MSRATQLAALGFTALRAQWMLAHPGATPQRREWAARYATKEQLADMIVTAETGIAAAAQAWDQIVRSRR